VACAGSNWIEEAPAVKLHKAPAARRAKPTPVPAAAPAIPLRAAATPYSPPPKLGIDKSIGFKATAWALAVGLPVSWLCRWAIAGILYLGRAIYDAGTPGRSSWLWIEITSVIAGLFAYLLICRIQTGEAAESAAGLAGRHSSDVKADAPWPFGRLALVLWGTFFFLNLSAHTPGWIEESDRRERHDAAVEEAEMLEPLVVGNNAEADRALELYEGVLRENPRHNGALMGRTRIVNIFIEEADRLYQDGNMPQAEMIYQRLSETGNHAQLVETMRGRHYRLLIINANTDWSQDIEIGDRFVEIVADGPIKIGSTDGESLNFMSKGSSNLDAEVTSIRIRSLNDTCEARVYIANRTIPVQTGDTLHLRKTRKTFFNTIRSANMRITIATIGSGNQSPTTWRNQTAPPARAIPALDPGQPIRNTGTFVARYRARISSRDKFTSKGRDLTKVENIKLQDFLQQDRYNFHTRGMHDRGDESDGIGRQRGYKAIASHLGKSLADPAQNLYLRNILDSEPLFEITIFQNLISVRLIER